MRIDHLPEPYADRVCGAKVSAPWQARCITAHAAQWVAWNVCEDAWYDAEMLSAVRATIDAVDRVTPGLSGPELLLACAERLQQIRVMTFDERDKLPAEAVTHVVNTRFKGKYEIAAESDWAQGSAQGELDPTFLSGQRIRVMPRGPAYFRWLTFDAGVGPVARVPDDIARTLGLDWDPGLGNVVRVEVPIEALRNANTIVAIPTLFDVIYDDPRYPLKPDWRARPEQEHRSSEPWGYARDMQHGGPALPEVIADVKAATKMDAEILEPVTVDWSTRPFLTGSGPK